MKVNLPLYTFSFYKSLIAFMFLLFALFFQEVAVYSFIVAIFIGKVHSIGAWFAMWRADKLNTKYVLFVIFITLLTSFFAFKVVTLHVLNFIAFVLFAVHFFYDEFILHEEVKKRENLLFNSSSLIILCLFLFNDFLHLNIKTEVFVLMAFTFFVAELLFLKEINWLYISNKMATVFILISIYNRVQAFSVLIIFIIIHYFFWFIYPVYKLHKHKREERDGFVLILLLITSSFLYFGTATLLLSGEALELTIKIFSIGTIIHILSTPPFGYLIGLPRSKYETL